MKRLFTLLTAAVICSSAFEAIALGPIPHDPCGSEAEEGDIYVYNVRDLETANELTATATLGETVKLHLGPDSSPSGEIYARVVDVGYSDGTSKRYYIDDNEKSYCYENLIITEDNLQCKTGTNRYFAGDVINVLSNIPNYLVADIDYVFLGDRVRRRARLTGEAGEPGEDEILHVQGLGLNRFVTDPDIFGHRWEYKLVSILDNYGNEVSGEDFHAATIETEPTKFIDDTVVKYLFAWNEWNPEWAVFYPNYECKIIGDEVVDHINAKKFLLDDYDKENISLSVYDGMFFQYEDVIYQTFFDGTGCEIYMRFDVGPGDNVYKSSNNADPVEGRVTEIAEVEILGETMRAVRFAPADESPYLYHSYWIEGVGPNMYGLDSDASSSWWGLDALDGLYKDEQCVFNYKDFYNATSVSNIHNSQLQEYGADLYPTYNLQGIRIDHPTPGQICIRNGRKFVNR